MLRSRSVQQAYEDRIHGLGLLVYLGRIDHVVLDFHRFWKVYSGELAQPLGTPKTDQLPGKKITDCLIALRGDKDHILYSGRPIKRSGKRRHAQTQKLAQRLG